MLIDLNFCFAFADFGKVIWRMPNLNPRDNELLATMIGNFQDGSVAGKLQFGSAWWFLDQKDGMTKQIEALSNMGLLGQFIGMKGFPLEWGKSYLTYKEVCLGLNQTTKVGLKIYLVMVRS